VTSLSREEREEGSPLLLPPVATETTVVDHGKIQQSEHLMSACARLGIWSNPHGSTRLPSNGSSGPWASICWPRCGWHRLWDVNI
jgi:hypothetical protein